MAKGSSSKRGLSKSQKSEVKDLIQDEIMEEVEMKYGIVESVTQVPSSPSIPVGDLSLLSASQRPFSLLNLAGVPGTQSASNYFDILPNIGQSISGQAGSKYNTRIGNQINLKSIDVKGWVNYTLPEITETDFKDHKIAVRLMILSQKRNNAVTESYKNMSGALLRNSNNGLENVNAFDAFPLDLRRPINRDVYTVHHDEIIYLTVPVTLVGTTSVEMSAIPSALKFFEKRLTFGKNGKKLVYSNRSANSPENFGMFGVLGYTSCTQNAIPSGGTVSMTYTAEASYTDM